MRFRTTMVPWLSLLGVSVVVAVLSGSAPNILVPLALVALLAAAIGFSLMNARPSQLLERSRSSLAAVRMTAEAREAAVRAKSGGSYASPDLTLMDIGMIAMQTGEYGVNMRRTRDVSLDDEGVRPFISLSVLPNGAERRALIRFELRDGMGKTRFVHEMRPYLRAGETDLLADHHLPLAAGAEEFEPGDWDLRVSIDGRMIGEHVFRVTPSLSNRFERARRAPASVSDSRARLSQQDADQPLSLEDLLRGQSEDNRRDRR
ncbi:MAG: hypothetical protein KME04_10920 [Pleurocapsa minor GSE-CHR-MK-17-07R]|nr:hypothetical protein [Pleurocapsa minor GSE-CHR-MK 17-07R]